MTSRRLEADRRTVARERAALAETERALRSREESVRERENTYRRRLDARLDDQLRESRREIDSIMEGLKAKATVLSQQAARRAAAGLNTGEAGSARAEALAALEHVVGRLKPGAESGQPSGRAAPPDVQGPIEPGSRVVVGSLGLEGVVLGVQGKHADIDMKGKRLRARLRDLRAIGRSTPPEGAQIKVSVDLQPREGSLSEVNVIGCTRGRSHHPCREVPR